MTAKNDETLSERLGFDRQLTRIHRICAHAVALCFGIGLELQHNPPKYFPAIALGLGALLLVAGVLAQQKRTYTPVGLMPLSNAYMGNKKQVADFAASSSQLIGREPQ